jgi:hypothetical protein
MIERTSVEHLLNDTDVGHPTCCERKRVPVPPRPLQILHGLHGTSPQSYHGLKELFVTQS